MIKKHTERIILLAILALGIFLRIYRLQELPPDMEGDVASVAVCVSHWLQGKGVPVSLPGVISLYFWAFPLGSLLIILCSLLVGIGRYALFLSSATIGVASLVLIYLLGKKLYDERVGLLSSLLLSLSLWHITVSRYGATNIVFGAFFSILIFLALYRIIVNPSSKNYLLWSVAIALALFSGSQYLVIIPIALLCYLLWLGKKGISCIKNINLWISIFLGIFLYLIFSVGFALVFHASTIWQVPFSDYLLFFKFRAPMVTFSHPPFAEIGYFVKELFFQSQPTDFAVLQVEGYPLLSPLLAISFLPGLIMMIFKRSPEDKLLLIWVIIPSLFYTIVLSPLSRYIFITLPAIVIISSKFFVLIFDKIREKEKIFKSSLIKNAVIVIFTSALILEGGISYKGYFVDYKNKNANLGRFYGIERISKFILDNASPNDSLLVFAGGENFPEVTFNYYTESCYSGKIIRWENIANFNSSIGELRYFYGSQVNNIFYIFPNPICEDEVFQLSLLHPQLSPVFVVKDNEGTDLLSIYKVSKEDVKRLRFFQRYECEEDIATNQGWKVANLGNRTVINTSYAKTPGSFISYSINIEKEGKYGIYLYMRSDGCRGWLQYSIDDKRNSPKITSDNGSKALDPYSYKLVKLGEESMTRGRHIIAFHNVGAVYNQGYQDIDYFCIAGEVPLEEIRESIIGEESLGSEYLGISFEKASTFFIEDAGIYEITAKVDAGMLSRGLSLQYKLDNETYFRNVLEITESNNAVLGVESLHKGNHYIIFRPVDKNYFVIKNLIIYRIDSPVRKYEAESKYFNDSGVWFNSRWPGISAMGISYYQHPDSIISYKIDIPETSEYDIYANVRWDAMRCSIRFSIDNQDYSELVRPDTGKEFSGWFYKLLKLGTVNISKGAHTITFKVSEPFSFLGYLDLDYFCFVKANKKIKVMNIHLEE